MAYKRPHRDKRQFNGGFGGRKCLPVAKRKRVAAFYIRDEIRDEFIERADAIKKELEERLAQQEETNS